ncbi:MAG TPA: hypothetical protein VGI80_04870 [Pyrinomonadaceae bacterium]|jgi:hypothetical protein
MYKVIFSSILIAILGVVGFSQRASSSQNANGNASANSGRNSGDISLAEGTHIDGELQKTLDVRNARPGDQVLLKTTRDIKQNGHTVIQKGSTLVGRVTDVAQRSKQNGQSRLGILFDRVQGHGLDMPITASIVSITNAAAHASAMDFGDADVMGSSSSSGGVSSSRSGRSSGGGGGLLGGVGNTVGGVTSGVTNTAGGVVNTTTQTVGEVTNTAGRTVGSTAGGVSSGASGISILSSGSTSASGGNGSILASSNQTIRLDKGSMIGLQLDSSSSASASRGH